MGNPPTERSMVVRREAEAVFEQLDALGWIDRVQGPYKGAPPHWTVNPAVHTKFADRAGLRPRGERAAGRWSLPCSGRRLRHEDCRQSPSRAWDKEHLEASF